MTTRRLAVVSAGLSQPSSTRLLADRLTAATRRELEQRDISVQETVVELRDHAHDLVDHLLTGFPSPRLRDALDAVAAADGLVAVTPIFNASHSGLFKSFFDVVDDGSLVDKPVLVAATGGTARHSLALEHAMRPLFSYLRAVVVPTSVFAATEDWGSDAPDGALARRVDRAAVELADHVERAGASGAPDPFEVTTPFEELLRGR